MLGVDRTQKLIAQAAGAQIALVRATVVLASTITSGATGYLISPLLAVKGKWSAQGVVYVRIETCAQVAALEYVRSLRWEHLILM